MFGSLLALVRRLSHSLARANNPVPERKTSGRKSTVGLTGVSWRSRFHGGRASAFFARTPEEAGPIGPG